MVATQLFTFPSLLLIARNPLEDKVTNSDESFHHASKTGHTFHYGVRSLMIYIDYKTHKDKHIQENRGAALKAKIHPVGSSLISI